MAERTLLSVAIGRVGVVKGAKVLAFMVGWDVARRELYDDWPAGTTAQVQAYAEWWRQSERTAWRELSRFHECFMAEATPDRLLDEAAAAAWDRRKGWRGLGAVKARGLAA